jgi:predicted dehydrogenase
MRKKLLLLALLLVATLAAPAAEAPPVRLAIVGLVHDHVGPMITDLAARHDVKVVGVVEPDPEVVAYYVEHYHLDRGIVFSSLDALFAHAKVEAVATFTATADHRRVVEACALRGVDVMMEKPMATNLPDARAMAEAARHGGIQLVVNYETTWYPSNHGAFDQIHRRNAIGDLRKIEVYDGHQGPKAIGCSPYFLKWLTDPVLNGGGAAMDFGCYGADVVTWLMDGQRPRSVFAVFQHLQPEVYPRVEDDATIVITYPHTQAVLQASWDWPFGRKDMTIYGASGYLRLPRGDSLLLKDGAAPEAAVPLSELTGPDADSLSYLVAVVRKQVHPSGLCSVATNLVVCEILDAARESARTGRRVDFTAAP